MEDLKKDGIVEKVVDIQSDLKEFKALLNEKFRNTPWLNEKDDLGLMFLSQFEDKINEMVVYYDLDESDRDLDLLRELNSKFTELYYQAKMKSTGDEALDILFSLTNAYKYSIMHKISNPEVIMLVDRVRYNLEENAFYSHSLNKMAVLAPYMYPEFTDNTTLNKPYILFATIGHEMAHSVAISEWANESTAFKNGMECLNDHFNRTCDVFGVGSCYSGAYTFREDGSDIIGQRINYEFLKRNYKEVELKETVFKSPLLSVNREQAFFYLYGIILLFHASNLFSRKPRSAKCSFSKSSADQWSGDSDA
ncbi:hypothetical protein PENTCL1PPCAC_28789 [Pristionchus entomophagus]|uniref:Peptidase M13 C-terminal domain-containing protein n=1 Tax=Pristionchus entomophagus TaxID=358040 RepID=A0AAV5UKZ2_9BILA|nr:hypothetical protein PENTCL1PPCAC_28789 [Pristionchus entomophagus]